MFASDYRWLHRGLLGLSRRNAQVDRFDAQDAAWRESVLPTSVRARLAIEAAHADYWCKYVGLDGRVIGMRDFGASAPAGVLMQQYGFTLEHVIAVARELLGD